MRYRCCTDGRRALVVASDYNGIDFVDVLDHVPQVPVAVGLRRVAVGVEVVRVVDVHGA
jgi:hypothetical protein